jgi:hypothetical protein
MCDLGVVSWAVSIVCSWLALDDRLWYFRFLALATPLVRTVKHGLISQSPIDFIMLAKARSSSEHVPEFGEPLFRHLPV